MLPNPSKYSGSWSKRRVGDLCDLLNGLAFKPEDWVERGIPIIRIQNLNGGPDYNYCGKRIPDAYLIPTDTILFSWSGNRGTSFGPFIWRGETGALNQHIFKITPKTGVDPKWLFYALDLVRMEAEKNAHGGLGLVHVRRGDMESYEVPSPFDIDEQRRIASILDASEATIRATEAVIEKLRLEKAGVHQSAFTESSQSVVPSPLSAISDFITSGSRGWGAYYSKSGPLFLRIGNLRRDHPHFRLDDIVRVTPPSGSEGSRTRVQPGDVLISITADLGMIGVVPDEFEEAYVNQHIALVRPTRGVANPYWIGYALLAAQGARQFALFNDAGAKAGLNLPTVGKITVPVPDISKQQRVVEALLGFDARLKIEEQRLLKLRLQHQGLLHDLLTGAVRTYA